MSLSNGSDLPDDWNVTFTEPKNGQIKFSAIGNTSIKGNELELINFDALVNPNAGKSTAPDLYTDPTH